jgi:hypothetical protein
MVRFYIRKMNGKKIYILILLLFSINAYAQIPEIVWQKCYGSPELDRSFGIVTKGDGLLIAIHLRDSIPGITNYHDMGCIWIVNTDSLGNIIWEKCFGGSKGDVPQKLIKKSEDEFFIFGYTYSTDGDVQSGNHGYSDIWVVKISDQGDILWEKTYGCIGIDEPRDMILTPDGGFVMIDRIGIGGGDVTNFYGSGDCWMAKCDSLGNIEWEKTLGNDGLDNCVSLMINSAGNIMMIGAAQWHGGLVECYPDGAWGDVWIVELDMQGNILAQYCYGGSHYDLGYMIIELDEGYAFVAGTTSNDGDVSGLHGPPGGPPGGWSDIWVVRLDEQMEIIWQKCIGGYDSELPNYITQTEDGGFVVIGTTRSNDGDVSGNPSWPGTYAALWVVKLNEQGDMEWQKCYGGWGSERLENPHTILKKSDYNYVLAATTNFSPSHDIQCGTFSGNRNAWIFEIALPDTVNVITMPASSKEIRVYPNPAQDLVQFEVQSSRFKAGELQLFDVYGRHVASKEITSEQTILDVSGLPGGVYFYKVVLGEIPYSGKIVIQR